MTPNLLIIFFSELLISVILMPSFSISINKSIQVEEGSVSHQRATELGNRSGSTGTTNVSLAPSTGTMSKNKTGTDEMDKNASESVIHKITVSSKQPLFTIPFKLNESLKVGDQQRFTSTYQVSSSDSSKGLINVKYPKLSVDSMLSSGKREARNESIKGKLKLYKFKSKIHPIKLTTKVIKLGKGSNSNSSSTANSSIAVAASYNYEDWVNYPPQTEIQPTTSATSNSETSATEPKSSEVSGSEQQHQQLEASDQVEGGQLVSSIAPKGSTGSISDPDRVHVRRESSSRQVDRPMVSKSITTTTTIGDGKKKAKVVSKSAALPPGLRQRIIEEFVKKGGNPQNIVVSDSTITTTSQSKKKTITTVYKVVPVSSTPKGRPRKNNRMIPKRKLSKTGMRDMVAPKLRPMMKLTGFEGSRFSGNGDFGLTNMKVPNLQRPTPNRFKEIIVTRTEVPKNMFISSPKLKMNQEKVIIDNNSGSEEDDTEMESDFDDSPQDGGVSIMPFSGMANKDQQHLVEKGNPVEFESPGSSGKQMGKFKLQMSPMVEVEQGGGTGMEIGDEGVGHTSSRQVKGISGGGISLNTLMDAIKHMQQMQSSGAPADNLVGEKSKPVFSSLTKQPHHSSDKVASEVEQPIKQHLVNFNDFNEKPAKKASEVATTPSSQPASEESPAAAGGLDSNSGVSRNEEQTSNSIAEQEKRRQQDKSSSGKSTLVGEISLPDTRSAEEKLEELKRAVFASTERLKERRSRVLAAATIKELEQEKLGNAEVTSKIDAEKRRFQESSKDQSESNKSSSKPADPEKPEKAVKTHNIMMLIDFNPLPTKSSSESQSSRVNPQSNQQAPRLPGNNHQQRDAQTVVGRPPRGFQQMGLQGDWFDNDNNQWRPMMGLMQNQQVRMLHGDQQDLRPLSMMNERLIESQRHSDVGGGLHQMGSEHQLDHPHPSPVHRIHHQMSDQVVGVPDYGDSAADEASADQHEQRLQQPEELQVYGQPNEGSSLDPQHHPGMEQDGGVAMFFDSPAASHRYQYKAQLTQPPLYQHLSHFLPHTATSIPGTLLGLFQQHFSKTGGLSNQHQASWGTVNSQVHRGPILPEESARTNQLVNQVIDELVASASSGELAQLVSIANLTSQVYHSPTESQPLASPVKETEAALPDDDDDEEMTDEETKRHLSVIAPNKSASSPYKSSSSNLSPSPPQLPPPTSTEPPSTLPSPSYSMRRKRRDTSRS